MYECEICGKKSNFEGVVAYFRKEFNLCRSHYLKWCRHHKPFVDCHKHIKPKTKAWEKMCKEEEKLFVRWFFKQFEENNKKVNLLMIPKKKGLIVVNIPLWVLKELIEEKKHWVEEALDKGEKPSKYEKWIVDNLPQQIKKC